MRNYENHELVSFNNLCPWSIYFHSETMRADVEIPPLAKNFKRMTFGDVRAEIAKGNTAFCGTNGFGDHAPLEIPDTEMREALFMRQTEPLQVTADILKKTLKQKSQQALLGWLEKYYKTVSEKKLLMVYLANLPDEARDDLPMWFHRLVEDHYYAGGTKAAAEEKETLLNW